MKMRKAYSKNLNLDEYFEMNMSDVWDGIKELQRATKVAALIALAAVLINSGVIKKLIIKILQKLNKLF